MFKYIYLGVLLVFLSINLFGQGEGVELTGQVIESSGQLPIEFATVVVKKIENQQVVAGTTTLEDGTFQLVSNSSDIYLEISFIGFVTKTITNLEIRGGRLDLGTIQLQENSQTLDEVVVRADKSRTEFKLDKRVFNVGEDLSSSGASALDVLNNVPSVNVNIEGEISLRGSSGVQILINGKPSIIASEQGNALGTITADMIDRIEVITNPSAKYEAEGTSGIINIIIKKEERRGINGSVSVNTGVPHNHSIGLSLNRRTEKFNLFSQLGVGYRSLPRENENINQDFVSGRKVESIGTEFRDEIFYNVVLGTDYHINSTSVLTLSGNFAYEVEEQPSRTDFTLLNSDDDVISEWYRQETTEANNPKWRYELQFKKDFKGDEEHDLIISALGNFFGKDQSSEFIDETISGDLVDSEQQTQTSFGEAKYTFQLDYTKPFTEKIKMELGGQYVWQDVSNDFSVSNLVNGEWLVDPGLTNVFNYDQKVLGIYTTGAYEADKWGIKAGIRVENTDLETYLENTDTTNTQNFTNFFPSLHTSYKVTERLSFQAGYSKRIFRPRLWDLNPFFNIRNNFTIRTGNPDLQPEFTDSYEVNGIYILDRLSMNLGVYHRYTTDVVERVSTFENNVNTFKPINIGTNQTTGVEFNAKYSPNKWLVLNGDVNFNYFNRQGSLEGVSFDFDANQWSSKLTSKFKLPAKIDLELSGNYRSAYQTIQSVVSDNYTIDFGVRKKLMDGKAILNLSVRDIFASRIRESEILQDDFYLYSYSRRGRFITLGFSYGFGKGEAMEFSGSRRH